VCRNAQINTHRSWRLQRTEIMQAAFSLAKLAFRMLRERNVSEAKPGPVVNRLLNRLPGQERVSVLSHCQIVDLAPGSILCEADRAVRQVYFPLTVSISLVESLAGHRPLEMGLIGNEGMLGVTLILGINKAPMRSVVRGTGTALRMSAAQFRRALHRNPSLLKVLNRYLYVTLLQLSQTTVCNHFHDIEARLARSLLMAFDRVHDDEIHITHELLAHMLGVRRSGVTIAAGSLQEKNLIHYRRGTISILDRPGLEAASCGCYDAVTDSYSNWLA
jgi:CRP-like cAMP-binding protein